MTFASLSDLAASAALASRFVVGLVFLVASVQKLADVSGFERAIRDYALVPRWLVRPIARLLPAIEFGSACLLLAGVGVLAAGSLLAALSLVFGGAAAINLARGRVIDCGCHGSAEARKISWSLVVADVALATMAGFAAAASPAVIGSGGVVAIQPSPAMTRSDAVAILLIVVLLYMGRLLMAANARLGVAARRLTAVTGDERV